MDQNNSFALRLKSLRRELQMSQYKLADELSVSRGLIGNYEQGRREPDFNTLLMFSNYFNVSTDYMLGATNIRKRLSNSSIENDIDKMVSEILVLSDSSIDDLKKYIALLKIRDRGERIK